MPTIARGADPPAPDVLRSARGEWLGKARLWLALVVVALALPARASASCLGAGVPRWAAHQGLVLLLNPMGAEHNLRLGLCVPLYDAPDASLALNHLELGAVTYVSPVYAIGGGYAQVVPASFLVLRSELSGMGVWPLPLDGAGYFARDGYDTRWTADDLPAAAATTASGWTFRGVAALRGRVDLAGVPWGGSLALVVYDAFFADYHELGSAAYFAQLRFDVVSARRDWVLGNEAMLMVGVPVDRGTELRIGAYDQTRDVPASGYVGNQIGGLVMLTWTRPFPGVDEISVFVRVGGYTSHGVRLGEATTLGGAMTDHDLGGL